MRILWILNKYVDGSSSSRFYPDFLKNVEEEIEESGNRIYFIFFTDAMRGQAKTKNNLFYNREKIRIKGVRKTAAKLENDYQFTFKQAYFPDLIQISRSQDYRKINLPEKELNNIDHLIPRFVYLEKIIEQKKIDVVFCDQSSEAEMEFGRSICLKKKKIFLRHIESFLGRCVFCRQLEFGKEKIARPILDKTITMSYVRNFVDDFIRNNRLPYPLKQYVKPDIKAYYLPRLLHFYRYPQFIKMAFEKPLLFLEEKFLKPLIEDKFDKNKPYIFFGFHLPTESTMALRALPYMTQISLIESISRVLPDGHFLYVREHPKWKKRFPFFYLKTVKKMPSVRLVSPEVPISEIIKNSRGVLTYNATTGIEALMYGKPVLSFSPNVYHGLHPSADYCSDLYELGQKLLKLINAKVNKEDTYRYVFNLMRSTTKISLFAGTFFSEEDSAKKAPIFVRDLIGSINYFIKVESKK